MLKLASQSARMLPSHVIGLTWTVQLNLKNFQIRRTNLKIVPLNLQLSLIMSTRIYELFLTNSHVKSIRTQTNEVSVS